MEIFAALLAYAACVALGVVATGPRFNTALAVPVAFAAPLTALFVPAEHAFVRFLFAALGSVIAMRVLDLALDRRPWSAGMRLWLFTGVVDVREALPAPRRVDPLSFVVIALYLGLAGFGWWVAHLHPDVQLLRWVGGVLVIYGLADAACGFAVPVYALAGRRIPRQHHAPILATSVGAFWSRHYNLNVSRFIARHFHRPLARRGRPRLGLLVGFGVSAIAHVVIAWLPLDIAMALSMGAFFCVQGVAAAIERSWPAFARLPAAIRRAWTIAWLLVPSPLFVEPFLRILEG